MSLKYLLIRSFPLLEDVACLGLVITSLIVGDKVLQRGQDINVLARPVSMCY